MLTRPAFIPSQAGIYVFRRGKIPLYIGKAADLKKRLASYFQNRHALPSKIQQMLGEATRLETLRTKSEVEALIKEAELIKQHHPKYNIVMRDDKNYFSVGVTRDEFSRIFITHQPQKIQTARYIGPFTSGTALKATLRLLRRIFPYCTCKTPHVRPCLNSQIGRCLGYCCTKGAEGSRSGYQKNIGKVVAVLTGKRTRLTSQLKKEMQNAAARERFEEAARLRDELLGLEQVFSHRPFLETRVPRYAWREVRAKLQSLLNVKIPIRRIEGYDISNISGTDATGSMVVFGDGLPDKGQYRKFKIKTVQGISDVDMLREVLRRRFAHPEWPMPQLIVVDGGKPQLGAALETLTALGIKNRALQKLRVTALAKREEILYTEGRREIPLPRQNQAILHLFQRVRDESHRFAKRYHHKRREMLYREKET